MVDPITTSLLTTALGNTSGCFDLGSSVQKYGTGLGSAMVGGSMLYRTIQDYRHPEKNISYIVEGKRETFQKRLQEDSEAFQFERDEANYRRQIELEAKRMEFQEHMEERRMDFQMQLQKRQEELQIGLAEITQRNNRDIAEFQALAMRETQVLISRMNASHMLKNNMILDALKSFPLSISPIVLLQSRPHSLKSLMRLTDKDDNQKLTRFEIQELSDEIESYKNNPEPLSVFVAPLQVSSKVLYNRDISTKLWELTFQKLEGIITRNYGPSSERPVMFYPTAWNDKATPGMHASETLHFFLKDMPCITLEPRFDGSSFSIVYSCWNIGYKSSEHQREESTLPIDVDVIIAKTVYNRSKSALEVMKYLDDADISTKERERLQSRKLEFLDNVRIYEALKIDEHIVKGTLDKLKSLGLLSLFNIDKTQDLEPLATIFAAVLGINISIIADTHHLLGTKAEPIFHKCVKTEELLNPILDNKEVCNYIVTKYENLLYSLRDAEKTRMPKFEEYRNAQVREISSYLQNTNTVSADSLERSIREYAKNMSLTSNDLQMDFDGFFDSCVKNMKADDKPFFSLILEQLKVDKSYKNKINKLKRYLEKI